MVIRSYEIPEIGKGEFSLELPQSAQFIRIKYINPNNELTKDILISSTAIGSIPSAIFAVDQNEKPIWRTFRIVKIEEEVEGKYIGTVVDISDHSLLYIFE